MMVRQPMDIDPHAPVLVIDIGNTAMHIATWDAGLLKSPLSISVDDDGAFDEGFRAHADALPLGNPAAVVVGSVVPAALERVRHYVSRRIDKQALVVGDNLPLPMDVEVEDRRAIGVDRVCAAAAAYEKLQHSCVVVDFGTAVTVDLVDDEGTLLGGAILPGLRLQLRALHEHTAQLPLTEPGIPQLAYGRNTVEAIQVGVCRGLAGAVRGIVEGYATSLNHWPQVLGTGGDVTFMAPHCDFLDTLVKDLTLTGIGLAYSKHLAERGA